MIVCPFKDLSRYADLIPGLEEAMKAVSEVTDFTPRTIPLSGGNRILVQTPVSKDVANGKLEAHRNYLDIQYVVKGEETVGWAPLDTVSLINEFNTEKDVGFYSGHVDFMRIQAGYCYVVFPEDAHMPNVYLDEPHDEVKLVVKLHL